MLRILIWCLCFCMGISNCVAGNAFPLHGYYTLCKTNPTLEVCEADRLVTHSVLPHQSSDVVMLVLEFVNKYWNEKITPITDLDKYLVTEMWNADTDTGDCEEFQLAKKGVLLLLGFDASQLLLALVTQANGDGHLVLIVRTDVGDLFLDNLTNKVLPLEKMPYTLIKYQDPNDPDGLWIVHDPKAPGDQGLVWVANN